MVIISAGSGDAVSAAWIDGVSRTNSALKSSYSMHSFILDFILRPVGVGLSLC